jgi:hypothetical protein
VTPGTGDYKKLKVKSVRKKGKVTLKQAVKALDRGGWSTPMPGYFTPGKDPVPIVQGAGWVPGPVWKGAENITPTGFDLLAVQPVARCYTDYAIPTPRTVQIFYFLFFSSFFSSAVRYQ